VAKVKRIENNKELMDELHIYSIDELKEESIRKRLFELTRQGRISEALIKELIVAVPELAKAFSAYVVALSNVGYEVEKTKQVRWEVLKECATQGVLTGDQILEAMKIIQDCEKNDPKINWEKVHNIALTATKGLGYVAILVAGGLLWALTHSSGNSSSSD
jgi:membrane-associated HD superfamily phosphohydrolase